MLKLIIWLLSGFVVIMVVSYVHLYDAEKRGYDAINYWCNYSVNMHFSPACFIFGLIIWPIRVAQFVIGIPDLYEVYDLKPKD